MTSLRVGLSANCPLSVERVVPDLRSASELELQLHLFHLELNLLILLIQLGHSLPQFPQLVFVQLQLPVVHRPSIDSLSEPNKIIPTRIDYASALWPQVFFRVSYTTTAWIQRPLGDRSGRQTSATNARTQTAVGQWSGLTRRHLIQPAALPTVYRVAQKSKPLPNDEKIILNCINACQCD